MEGTTQNLDAFRKEQETLLHELGLIEGMPVSLAKVVEENPELPQSQAVNGFLDRMGQFGYAISVNNGESSTPPLTQIDVHDNRTYFRCGTSIYELIPKTTQTEPASESVEKRKPKSIITSKDSIYTYLTDGRTQRYKTAENRLEAPQDLLVFIPPWKMIEKKAVQLYPEIFSGVENEVQFEQIILEYMEIDGPRTIRPAINGQEVYSLLEISSDAQVFLNFINKIEKKIDFALPTSRDPKLGYTTFDAREFIDEKDGKLYKERHIGHKIVSIEYE